MRLRRNDRQRVMGTGTLVHGNIWWVSWNDFMGLPHPDFCWETENGTVLVDFKTCPKGKTAILDYNGKFYAGHYQP